eukprot:4365129-Amphidinium_carterae.1
MLTPLPAWCSKPVPKPRLRQLVDGHCFELTFATMILINMVIFGLEVEHAAQCRCSRRLPLYQILDYIFNLAFVIELGLRVAAYRKNFFKTRDWEWNMVDTVIVAVSMVELLLTAVLSDIIDMS